MERRRHSAAVVAQCVGTSPSAAPHEEDLLEALAAGASPDEGLPSDDDDRSVRLTPLLLLMRKDVLNVGSRAQSVLGEGHVDTGACINWDHVASRLRRWDSHLSHEQQPVAWWRLLHAVLTLLQLPQFSTHADDEEAEATDESGTSARDSRRVASAESPHKRSNAILRRAVLTSGTAMAAFADGADDGSELAGWRTKIILREKLMDRVEEMAYLAHEAREHLEVMREQPELFADHQRWVYEGVANERHAAAALVEAERHAWREFMTQLGELEGGKASPATSPAGRRSPSPAGGRGARRTSVGKLRRKLCMSMAVSSSLAISLAAGAPGSPASPLDGPRSAADAATGAVVAAAVAPGITPGAGCGAGTEVAEAEAVDEAAEEAEEEEEEEDRPHRMTAGEWRRVRSQVLEEKVLSSEQLASLRQLAASAPSELLARGVCRIILLPPELPAEVRAILERTAAITPADLKGLEGGDMLPALRLLQLCRCCLEHSSVRRCIGKVVRAGADVGARDGSGRTALHLACSPARPFLLRHLLGHHLDTVAEGSKARVIDMVDHHGRSAAALAVGVGTDAERFCLQTLLRSGASILRPDSAGGGTLVHLAAEQGSAGQLKAVLEASAAPEAAEEGSGAAAFIESRDREGLTPLCLAVRLRRHKCVGVLLSHGAQLLSRDASGLTPLHHAAEVMDAKCVDLLLSSTDCAREREAVLLATKDPSATLGDSAGAQEHDPTIGTRLVRESPLVGTTPLCCAARQQSAVILSTMMSKVPLLWRLDHRANLHNHLLVAAMEVPSEACVGAIMKGCLSLQGHMFALMRRCVASDRESLLPLVCRWGYYDPEAQDVDGQTLLHRLTIMASDEAAGKLPTSPQAERGAAASASAAATAAAAARVSFGPEATSAGAAPGLGAGTIGARLLGALLETREDLHLFAPNADGLTALGAAPAGSACAQMLLDATVRSLRRANVAIIINKREHLRYDSHAAAVVAELEESFPGLRVDIRSLVGMQPGEEGCTGSFELLWESDEWRHSALLYSQLATGRLPSLPAVVAVMLRRLLGSSATPQAMQQLQAKLARVPEGGARHSAAAAGAPHAAARSLGAEAMRSKLEAAGRRPAGTRGAGSVGAAMQGAPAAYRRVSSHPVLRNVPPTLRATSASALRPGKQKVSGILRKKPPAYLLEPLKRVYAEPRKFDERAVKLLAETFEKEAKKVAEARELAGGVAGRPKQGRRVGRKAAGGSPRKVLSSASLSALDVIQDAYLGGGKSELAASPSPVPNPVLVAAAQAAQPLPAPRSKESRETPSGPAGAPKSPPSSPSRLPRASSPARLPRAASPPRPPEPRETLGAEGCEGRLDNGRRGGVRLSPARPYTPSPIASMLHGAGGPLSSVLI